MPAIFAITTDTFVVYTANIMAILLGAFVILIFAISIVKMQIAHG